MLMPSLAAAMWGDAAILRQYGFTVAYGAGTFAALIDVE